MCKNNFSYRIHGQQILVGHVANSKPIVAGRQNNILVTTTNEDDFVSTRVVSFILIQHTQSIKWSTLLWVQRALKWFKWRLVIFNKNIQKIFKKN